MADKENILTIIEHFEDHTVRKVWHQGEWWFSLVDVAAVFSGTHRARKYWNDLKKKILQEEGYSELSDQIGRLKFEASDGKRYTSDAGNFTTISRIVQSIASPRAEPFKQWLSGLAAQEVRNIEDPEAALFRLRTAYEQLGRPPQWIKVRLEGIQIRKRLQHEWEIRGVVTRWEHDILTEHISTETFGVTTTDHKQIKSLQVPQGEQELDLREHYTTLEHALVNLSEAAAHEFTVQRDSQGFERIQQDVIDGGKVGGRARKDLEDQGLHVVSDQNFLDSKEPKHLP